jgi:pimeloyl-ACP methyl ester carboxylesterase
LCLPPRTPLKDPEPDETRRRDVELTTRWNGKPAGVVGWSEGGWKALELAARHPDLVDRLVLVGVPRPNRQPAKVDVTTIATKTLLLYTRDVVDDGKWFRKQLPNMRMEEVKGTSEDLLPRVWPRVLSFLAPHTLHKR